MATYTKSPFKLVKGAESGVGPIVGTIVIVLVISIGGLYFWADRLNKAKPSETATTTQIVVIQRSAPRSATSTGNPELDVIRNNLESRTQNIDSLNF